MPPIKFLIACSASDTVGAVRRKRLGLRTSVGAAVRAASDTPAPSGGADADVLGYAVAAVVGMWWWIRGAPMLDEPPATDEHA